jgi:hypothetical protein
MREHCKTHLVRPCAVAVVLMGCACALLAPSAAAAVAARGHTAPERVATTERTGGSLEAAASRAGSTGRAVAMSLLGLALAIAATVLAFRRDFREAAGVFAVGIVSVLLATPAGLHVLKDTVAALFGS